MPRAKTAEQVLAEHTEPLLNGCIVWTGSRDKGGYGKCKRRHPVHGLISLPHRLAYILAKGAIPSDMEIDHECRNRSCVNPNHLTARSHIENIYRIVRLKENHRNSKKTHCKFGHPLSGENLMVEVWRGISMRKCRICKAARTKAMNEARRLHKIKVRET